jgi:Na+-transporting NADH:ubiquinone oxidoreductase subunit C
MLSNTQKSFLFAFVMCVICSLLLALASVGLKERQEKNILIDKQRNILKAVGLLDSGVKYSSSEIETLYADSIQEFFVDNSGQLVKVETSRPVYVLMKGDVVSSYAMPFKAYGLWSWVKGYIALAGDGNTVVGMTVYEHGETPGLGGEVEKAWFQKQFVGKKITDNQGVFVSIGVSKGKAADSVSEDKLQNFVDGISGSTITSKGMEKYIKIDLESYEVYSKKLRGQ